MNNIAGSLHYDTKMDTSGIDKGVNDVEKKAKGVSQTMAVAIGNIISNLASIAVQGLKQIASAGITYNAQIEKYQTALTTLTKDADKANKIIEQIKEDAARTPFDVNGLVQANQLLISAGVSSEKARKDILALGNAVSATGGGNEELQRMAVNLQQIKNVGKASSLDIKQFAYAGIDVYGLLADATGKTRKEVADMKVTYDDLTYALAFASEEGGRYANAMENQSLTLNGQLSNLKDNLNAFIGDAMTPLFTLLRDDVLPVVNALIQSEGNAQELLVGLSDKLINFVTNALTKLIDMLPQMVDIGVSIILNLVDGITKQIPTLVKKVVEVIEKIGDTIIDNLDLIVDTGLDLIIALSNSLVDNLPTLLSKIPSMVEKMAIKFTEPETLAKIISAGGTIIYNLMKGMIQATLELYKLPKTIGRDLGTRFREAVNDIDWKEFGKWIIDGIKNGISSKATELYDKVKSVLSKALEKAKKTLKIGSPSKVFADEIGHWIPAGVAVGIEANTDSVDKALDDLNDDMVNKMTKAVNVETGKINFSGTNGTVTQMLSAYGTTIVENNNKLYLDGDEIYANQQIVSAKKNLQTQFGGGYSVSS